MAEVTASGTDASADQAENAPAVEVSEVELPEATDGGQKNGGGQIDILLDTAMTIAVRLGQAETTIRELLQLGPGSVLQLDREIGEPVDLYLHDARFATGSLVVVGEQLGVRIREILSSPSAAAGGAENDH